MALFDRALTPANVIDDLRFLADLAGVRLRHLHESARTSAIVTRPQLRDVERQSIEAALAESGGKVFGADGAAARLAMKPTTLASRIKALGVNVSERYN
jgi:transcriptional regulator with GAF, ATPase, and Fis domain